MVGSVGTVVGSPPRMGGAASTATADSSRPSISTSTWACSAGIGCWPSSAEVVHTTGRPIASANSCQVKPLANRATTICSVTSFRVMATSMHPDPRIRLAVSAFRNPEIGVAAGCRLRSIRSSATRIEVAMRIVIDLNRCLGYAQCVPLAPEVLKLSGEETLTYDPNPDDSQRLRVLRAAASCPVQAIIVDRLDTE